MKRYTIDDAGRIVRAPVFGGQDAELEVEASSKDEAMEKYLGILRHLIRNQPAVTFSHGAWILTYPNTDKGFDAEVGLAGNPSVMQCSGAVTREAAIHGASGYYGTREHLDGRKVSGAPLIEQLLDMACRILDLRHRIKRGKIALPDPEDDSNIAQAERCLQGIMEAMAQQVNFDPVWDNHPDHPATDWIDLVHNGETRMSYTQWVMSKLKTPAPSES